MKIKICGITRLEDARFCAGAGADYLGFIQYEQSPRYVEPEFVGELVSWIYGPEPVGVFVDEAADAVNRIAEKAGFRYVQLHGDEPPELCAEVALPVIRAVRVFEGDTTDSLRRTLEAYHEVADFFLLDTGRSGARGGTGETFDWNVARPLADEYPLFLAGGISADNVVQAVEAVNPFAVDASSSLESSPGVKDFERLAAFFDAARTVDA